MIILAWSPQIVDVFENCKTNMTTVLLLPQYDSSKPIFFKTDWSADGMGYILIQPENLSESIAAIKYLESTGEWISDLTLSGPRLIPVLYNSRSNLDREKDYHLFVGDIACGRWTISRLRKKLWETFFYWLCGCNTIKEILEYNVSIHQLKQWTQKLLAYEFVIIHPVAAIMKDGDGVSRHVDPLFTNTTRLLLVYISMT